MSANVLAIQQAQRRMAARAMAVTRAKISTWPGGISHREIAERAGLSKGFVTRFLNGRVPNPTLYSLVALATALDCHFEFELLEQGKTR